jgi:hypothetical protein
MRHSPLLRLILVLLIPFGLAASASQARAQASVLATGLIEGLTAGTTTSLTGYAITAIGLNSQAAFQTSVLNQLSEINTELDTISAQLSEIENDIETETCVDELSSSAVTDALTSIATVSNMYTDLLQAGESTNGTVSPADINNFLNQVANGPGGSLPSISAALAAINIALQSTDNEGIIGTCEKAVTSVPGTGSFGADASFYSDPINLLQYFADYQTVAALLLVEYYHYEAFLNSPYYSATVISNGLTAPNAGEVCANPTGNTAAQCIFARDALEQLYVYLQNQYSIDGVPYSTKDSSGNLQTGLYMAGDNTNYLFAASLEEFTNFEDIPQNNCPSVMTSAGNPCGLTYRDDPSTSPFWTDLYNPVYQYETGWAPATAEMWRAVLSAWADGGSSQTVAEALTTLGFQNASNKIILTTDEYDAEPAVSNSGGTLHPFTATAVCFLDTDLDRSLSVQPWCFNGSSADTSYGDSGTLLWLWSTWDNGDCMTFRTNGPVLSGTNDAAFYGTDNQYDSNLSSASGVNDGTCPSPSWVDGLEPGWLIVNGLSGSNFFWPAIDVSDPTCGTNLSFGLLQPAVTRTATNFLGVPTMCGSDFDTYFSDEVVERNPYQQIAFTTPAVSGGGSSSASLGPITIQLQDTYTGSAEPVTVTSATAVDLSSTSLTGVFSLTQNGASVSSVTIPSGSSSVSFYYGDSTAGTPQITADPGTTVPGAQVETITSANNPSPNVVGSTQNVGTDRPNGKIKIRGIFTLPKGIQLQRALLTFTKLLSEDGGAGELVHQSNGVSLRLPVTLNALKGSTADDAVYRTARGITPRVHVEVAELNHKTGRSRFQIEVNRAEITSPTACSDKSPTTTLHTRMVANDGSHPSAVFDANIKWSCHRNGRLSTPAS